MGFMSADGIIDDSSEILGLQSRTLIQGRKGVHASHVPASLTPPFVRLNSVAKHEEEIVSTSSN